MNKPFRYLIIKLHFLTAGLVLPIAIAIFLTGALYTWEIKGGYKTKELLIKLDDSFPKEATALKPIIIRELQKNSIDTPGGWSGVIASGENIKYEWRGLDHIITLEPTNIETIAKLTIHEASIYRKMVLLHKAEGDFSFKIYTTILAVAILFLLISGYILAWQIKAHRNLLLTSTIIGIAIFILLFFIQSP